MKGDEKELEEIHIDLIRWKHFFYILSRPYVWIPFSSFMLYLAESKPIGIASFIVSLFQGATA